MHAARSNGTGPTRPRVGALALVAALVATIVGLTGVTGTAGATSTPAPAVRAAAAAGHRVEPERFITRGPARSTSTFVPPRSAGLGRLSTNPATILVTYHGFSPQAQAAFGYAVQLWSRLIQSPVPIRIDATWTPMGDGILGGARPSDDWHNFVGAPVPDVWYPNALADSLAGYDLEPGSPDITARFNSSMPYWYLGTDGHTPGGQWDLVSVVLHEIGHGLGFSGFLYSDGSYGYKGDGSDVSIFDTLVTTPGGTPMEAYPDDTAALGTALQSGARFNGNIVKFWNGGNPAVLYAPSSWEQGSSIYHFDESTYPAGNANALMTPILDGGEAVYDPGELGLSVFRDIGWKTTGVPTPPASPNLFWASAGHGAVDLAWTGPADTGRGRITGYRVREFLGSSSTPATTVTLSPTATTTRVTGLTDGTAYHFTVQALNAYGASADSASSGTIVPLALGPFRNVDALVTQQFNDLFGRAPTSAELAAWRKQINAGTPDAAGFINQLLHGSTWSKSVPPAIRLYSAYFLRLPDESGLAYWGGRLRSGTTLAYVSQFFASSNEFTTRYGALSNSAFVNLVYTNVLGRAPDSGGLSYWVGQLGKGVSRGSVMIGFSESAEFKDLTYATTEVVGLYHAMLKVVPDATTLTAQQTRLTSGTPLTTLAAEILASAPYDARIP